MIAFRQLGVPSVERYVAYEVEPHAISLAKHNFPFIEEMGDIFQADFKPYIGFDWIIGGSPCTFWSVVQKKGRETTASGMGWELFSQYLRALHTVKPRYFLYENNKSMSKEIRSQITKEFGFEPHELNSALVSAQNRERLYWVGERQDDGTYRQVKIRPIRDRGITVPMILDPLRASLFDSAVVPAKALGCATRGRYINDTKQIQQHLEVRLDGKTNTITTVPKDCLMVLPLYEEGSWSLLRQPMTTQISGKNCVIYPVRNHSIETNRETYQVSLQDGFYVVLKPTLSECKRIQTIPDWYSMSCAPEYYARRCIGNGWTVEIIKHLISSAIYGGGTI